MEARYRICNSESDSGGEVVGEGVRLPSFQLIEKQLDLGRYEPSVGASRAAAVMLRFLVGKTEIDRSGWNRSVLRSGNFQVREPFLEEVALVFRL